MAQYFADVLWLHGEQYFIGNQYSRKHILRLDGCLEIPRTSSPHIVPLPMQDASAIDPE
ncbi:MAG: hypothetical protein RL571_1843 [Pseudomonadota bacterium]|jgi:hypothetical protein